MERIGAPGRLAGKVTVVPTGASGIEHSGTWIFARERGGIAIVDRDTAKPPDADCTDAGKAPLLLASEGSSFTTGSCQMVDGGLHSGWAARPSHPGGSTCPWRTP